MEADAWATALNVLGPGNGLATAEREGLAALLIERSRAGALRESATSRFEAYRAAAPSQGGTEQ
jgi:thiamine biosynthesis lipoprotein